MAQSRIWCKSGARSSATNILESLLTKWNGKGFSAGVDIEIELQALELVSDIQHPPDQRTLFRAACSYARVHSKADLALFEEAVGDTKAELAAKDASQSQRWLALIPIAVQLPRGRYGINVNVLGTSCGIVDGPRLKELATRYRLAAAAESRLSSLHSSDSRWHNSNAHLYFRAYSRSAREVWSHMSSAFHFLRGSIELTLSFGGWRLSSGFQSHLRAPIGDYILLVNPDGNADATMLSSPSASGMPSPNSTLGHFKATDIETVKFLASAVGDPPRGSSLTRLLMKCVQLYGMAMEQPFHQDRLLYLWQIAEEVTLSHRHSGRTEVVIDRLAQYPLRGRISVESKRPVLKRIAKLRNDFVHHGKTGIVQETDTNQLKRFCDSAILWLFQKRSALVSENALESWFQFSAGISRDPDAVQRALNVAKLENLGLK